MGVPSLEIDTLTENLHLIQLISLGFKAAATLGKCWSCRVFVAFIAVSSVYIVLCGENGFSGTKELHAPGCPVFRRNSTDTFIISAAESLGSLWGIHIWHDNSGPSPTLYLKHIEVCELNRDCHQVMGRTWLFIGQCWLAVDKGDGRVERMLSKEKMGFAKVMWLKVCDYMADFHIWISAHSCSNGISFTRCRRLSVCVLLLLGYACVSAVLISQNHRESHLELDIGDLSVLGVTTGIFSVVLVTPAATLVSFLFRLSEVKILRSDIKCSRETRTGSVCFHDTFSLTNSLFETYFSWSVLHLWLQESWRKKYQDKDPSSASSLNLDDRDRNGLRHKEDVFVVDSVDELLDTPPSTVPGAGLRLSLWGHCGAWLLWLLLGLSFLVTSAAYGVRFSSKEATLWVHSLFFSLLFCVFFLHPLLVFTMALVVSVWYKNRPDYPFLSHQMHESIHEAIQKSTLHGRSHGSLLQSLEARQRVRFLRLVRPPTLKELRKCRLKRKRDALVHQTLLDFCVFASMLVLLLWVTAYGSSSSDCCNLNKAVRKHFIRDGFMSIRTYGDWWGWAQSRLLDALHKNTTTKFAAFQKAHFLIGEPVLWKTDDRRPKAFSSSLLLNSYSQIWKTNILTVNNCSENLEPPTTAAKYSLGHTRILSESDLKRLDSQCGRGRRTVTLEVYFALYSPALSAITSVTLTVRPSLSGVLQPTVQALSLFLSPVVSKWDYAVLTCKMLFLILLLLRLCHQILVLSEKGLIRFCKLPCNWLEVALSVLATVYYVFIIYRTVLVSDVAEMLQKQKTHIDFTALAAWDQRIRSLCGALLFLLTLRCVCLVKKTVLPSRWICAIFGILVAGFALSCMRDTSQSSGFHHFFTSHKLNSRGNSRCPGLTFMLTRLVWTALVINVVLSVRGVWRRRDMFTTTDLVQYVKYELFSRRTRSEHTDQNMERKAYYFEQLESVLDELLLKLDRLCDRTLPSEVHHCEQDAPVSSKQDISLTDTADYPETNVMTLLSFFHSKTSDPHEFNFLLSKDQKGKGSKGIMYYNKVQEEETKCDTNTEERVKKPAAAAVQPVSAEMVVEALIHEDADLQQLNLQGNNFTDI